MRYLKGPIYELRDALDRLGSVAAINLDGEFLAVSDSFTDLFGYSDEEAVGQHMRLLNHGDHMPAFFRQMWADLDAGEPWMGEFACRHKDGSSIEIRVSIAPSFKGSAIAGYVAQYQQALVQRRHAELSDVLYRYRAGFNKIAALAVVSRSGVVQEVNDVFVQLYGYARSEIIGRPISLLRSSATSPEVHARLWATIKQGHVWGDEVENKCKDGRSVFVRATIAPSAQPYAEVGAACDDFLVIYQDITREIELRRSEKELAIEAARQQLLAGTLHNIGNLQQSVMAANEKTLQGAEGLVSACQQAGEYYPEITDPEQRNQFFTGVMAITAETAEQILGATRDGRKAISDTISVLHSFRRQQRNIRPVDDANVAAFVQQTLSTFALQAAQHNIGVSISAMMEGNVRWPIAQVQQIVFNLLKNAKEAICGQIDSGALREHGGTIDLATEVDGQDVVFRVQDNAGGFDVPSERLFAHGFTTKATGVGIGLHSSAVLAQSMGGGLSAENVQDGPVRGARFTLRLPRSVAALG